MMMMMMMMMMMLCGLGHNKLYFFDETWHCQYCGRRVSVSVLFSVLFEYFIHDFNLCVDNFDIVSSQLRELMGNAEQAKQKAAATYDLTVTNTSTAGASTTNDLLNNKVVKGLVQGHVPDALKTKGRDEFSKREGGLKTRDRVVLETYETEQKYLSTLTVCC